MVYTANHVQQLDIYYSMTSQWTMGTKYPDGEREKKFQNDVEIRTIGFIIEAFIILWFLLILN